MVRYPPLALSFRQPHLCDTPFCNVSRDSCAIPHKNKHGKNFVILSLQVSRDMKSIAAGPLNPQNRAKIHQKYSKNAIFGILVFALFCLWGRFPILWPRFSQQEKTLKITSFGWGCKNVFLANRFLRAWHPPLSSFSSSSGVSGAKPLVLMDSVRLSFSLWTPCSWERVRTPFAQKPKCRPPDLIGPNRAMQPRCAMRFQSHTPKSPAIRKALRLLWNHRKDATKARAKILQCWPAMWNVGVYFINRAMQNLCGFDSRCSLACKASVRDTKSPVMWVERCEALSSRFCKVSLK